MVITISYQPQHLAPPFAYAAVFKFEIGSKEITAELTLEYLGRDTISLDELKAEGFTKNDDYSWRGVIDPKWKADILSFSTLQIQSEPDSEIYLHIAIEDEQKGFAKDIQSADVLFQELLQAVIEQDQIEAPLKIQLRLNNKPYEITWEFSKRVINKNEIESKDWETGREIMNHIYALDFDKLTGIRKPSSDSVLLDELWYPINDNIKNNLISNLENLG